MSDCPFLSTFEEKIPCFEECVFNNYIEIGECPFKKTSTSRGQKKNIVFEYDLLATDSDDSEDDLN